MYLIRLTLIFIIIALIVRAFIIAGSTEEPVRREKKSDNFKGNPVKSVPKSIGEYVDYEEIDKPE